VCVVAQSRVLFKSCMLVVSLLEARRGNNLPPQRLLNKIGLIDLIKLVPALGAQTLLPTV
jgi:hypothetical protein